jgi:hypothetical protein
MLAAGSWFGSGQYRNCTGEGPFEVSPGLQSRVVCSHTISLGIPMLEIISIVNKIVRDLIITHGMKEETTGMRFEKYPFATFPK